MQIEPEEFYKPKEIFNQVKKKVNKASDRGELIDYLTFVPDGEPTLDINLKREIELLKPLGFKIAVITNASLINRSDVRETLRDVDWVSLKIDSVQEEGWHKINRPYGKLCLSSILEGIREFASLYRGELVTETMLIKDVNYDRENITAISDFIYHLEPTKAYLAIPTRPPAEKWAHPPSEKDINHVYQIFSKQNYNTELLIGYEGNAFAYTGNVEEDLLSITSVHPMREDALKKFLKKANTSWNIIHRLITEDKIIETEYKRKKFYMRKIHLKNN
jgi:wyosine [tRNA(Phe)-imidazoG37] synthetase (radical SAM superfamily)